ncbi:nucleolin-like [Homalodisca vitripennis]|uniref:nucleolin-like n=1 Tax=Homalodisca vitripennis TaxID=197043 RepID=UPI001EEC0ABD|nr:nucleolin-like [Homalodisca vitripennis]
MTDPPEKRDRPKRSCQGNQNPHYEPVNLDDSEIEGALNDDDEEGDLLRHRDRFFDVNEVIGNWSDDTDEDPTYEPPNEPDRKEDTSEEDPQPEAIQRKEGKRKKALTKKKGDGAKKSRKTKNQDKDFSPPWRTGPFNPTPLTIAQPAYLPIDSDDWTAEQYVQQYFDDDILKKNS